MSHLYQQFPLLASVVMKVQALVLALALALALVMVMALVLVVPWHKKQVSATA